MFVVQLRYPNPAATLPFQAGHVAWVTLHAQAGRFVLTGPSVPRTGGIILADVPSRGELDAILLNDPYAKAGTTYEITEFTVSNGSLMGRLTTLR